MLLPDDSVRDSMRSPRRRPGRPRPPRIAPRDQWPLEAGINVVLFAGLGGACEGMEAAGYPVHLAINHDAVAIAVHKHRNPHTEHLQTDVFEVDPRTATRGRRVNNLWASPDCRHHSRAKGGKPVSNRVRSLPWVVCRWAGQVKPDRLYCENVSELRSWCPLIAKRDPETGRVLRLDGSVAAKGERVPVELQQLVPDPKRKGRTFRAWQRHLRALGQHLEDRDLTCADFGIATTRRRFWMVGKRVAEPITWRKPSHAARDKAPALGLKDWVAAWTIIDWTIPMRSIFGRKKDLAEATLRRIARGVMRFVINAAKPFIIPVTHPRDVRVHSMEDPLRTLTGAHRGELAVIAPSLSTYYGDGGDRTPRVGAPTDPVDTFTTENRHAVMAPCLVPRYGEREGQEPRCQDAQDPLATQVNTGNGAGLVAAHLTKFRTDSTGADLDEPLPTYTASSFEKRPGGAAPLGVVGAFLQRYYGGSVGTDAAEPLATQSGEIHDAVTAAWMVQHNTGEVGHDMAHPVSTMVQKMCTQALAAAHLVKLRGTAKDGQSMMAPIPALSAQGNHIGLIAPFLMKYYSAERGQAQRADEPFDALTVKARFGVVSVVIDGQPYAITDILMRMLEPEEGAAAHGFQAPYFPDQIEIFEKGKLVRRALTKAEKMALVGNSVPPEMARILVEDNCPRSLAVGGAPTHQRGTAA